MLLIVAAINYVSHAVRESSGPGEIFVHLRKRLGFKDGTIYSTEIDESFLTSLLECNFCFSIWAAGFVLVIKYLKLDFLIAALGLGYLSNLVDSIILYLDDFYI